MHLGLIGYGNIAAALVDLLESEALSALTVLVRPGRAGTVTHAGATVVEETGALIARAPDLVVECAGHGAVAESASACLAAGIDTVVVSVGALADPALHEGLLAAARAGGARLVLPAGAIGGIDLLAALAPAGGLAVTYTGTKPPAAWRGTPAEAALDLDALDAPATFFSGTAREAARAYPKNANVAATLALAGAGFDATRVDLVADPGAAGNAHAYRVTSPLARYEMTIGNNASAGNAKTSAATIYSVLREIRNRIGPVVI
jgi:aspartate dehydrogenase